MIKLLVIFLSFVVASVLFFGFTNPDDLAVGWLMIPVLLVFGLFSLGTYILLKTLFKNPKNHKRVKSLAILAGVSSSLILLFQSTGGIVLADVLLMTLILVITYLYINKY